MPGAFDTHNPDTDNWDAEPNAAAVEIWPGKAGSGWNLPTKAGRHAGRLEGSSSRSPQDLMPLKAGTSRNRSSHRRRAACEPPQAIMVIWMIFFWMAYCTSCALL